MFAIGTGIALMCGLLFVEMEPELLRLQQPLPSN